MSGTEPGPSPPTAASSGTGEDDPSMEDILASIRRILNDGETAPGTAADADPGSVQDTRIAPDPMGQAALKTLSAGDRGPPEPNDVFILDTAMMVSEDASTTADFREQAPLAAPETVAAASESLGALRRTLSDRQAQTYRGSAVSVEDIVRDEVRPQLKSWLDAHLPAIVERLVRAEIERVVQRDLN